MLLLNASGRLPEILHPTAPSFTREQVLLLPLCPDGVLLRGSSHWALLPCHHHLSLFLSKVTLCCVSMVTMGHHFEECNREMGRKAKSQSLICSWAPATSEMHTFGSSHFMEGEADEWASAPLNPVNGGAKCKI